MIRDPYIDPAFICPLKGSPQACPRCAWALASIDGSDFICGAIHTDISRIDYYPRVFKLGERLKQYEQQQNEIVEQLKANPGATTIHIGGAYE